MDDLSRVDTVDDGTNETDGMNGCSRARTGGACRESRFCFLKLISGGIFSHFWKKRYSPGE